MYALEELVTTPATLRDLAGAVESAGPFPLRCAKIKLTSRCNLRCHMCRYWETREENALPTGTWVRILEEMGALGCRKVHFSGGEVLLRPDIVELVAAGRALGLKVNLTTNGTLLTNELARALVRARVHGVSLSLDAPRASMHDGIRGVPGSFRRTCAAIRRLQHHGERQGHMPRIRLNTVVMQDTFRLLPAMVDLAGRLGVVELHPMPVDEKGERKRRLSRGQIERYNRDIAPEVAERRRRHGFSTAPHLVFPFGVEARDVRLARQGLYARGAYEDRPCLAPWLHLYAGWDGEVFPCCMTSRRMASLGSLARASVAEIWTGEAYRALRAGFRDGRPHDACHRCDMWLGENALIHEAMADLGPDPGMQEPRGGPV